MSKQATMPLPDDRQPAATAAPATAGTVNSSTRQPWVAALMSLMLPGFGQLYCGMMSRAFWLFLAFIGTSALGLLLVSLLVSGKGMLAALVVLMLITFGIWIFSIIDAWRQATATVPSMDQFAVPANMPAGARENALPTRSLQPWQHAATYVGVFLLSTLMLLPALFTHIRTHYVQAFSIPSASMEPALLRGDFVFADMRYNCPGCRYPVRHDDVAIFINPNQRKFYYVKRIIGLPGDRIDFRNGNPVVTRASAVSGASANSVTADSAVSSDSATEVLVTDSIVVPDGHVYVVGDNRDNSRDSRSFGPVPMADVKARVRQVWFSRSDEGVRWDRIGHLVNQP